MGDLERIIGCSVELMAPIHALCLLDLTSFLCICLADTRSVAWMIVNALLMIFMACCSPINNFKVAMHPSSAVANQWPHLYQGMHV